MYRIWGAGRLRIVELDNQLNGFKEGCINQVLIENASATAGTNIVLPLAGICGFVESEERCGHPLV